MNPELFVIIVTYNAMPWAERCFTSLRKSSVPVRTIVVDNGSTDGTQDFIKTNFPEVEFIQSAENLGFGKANNLGIERAYKAGANFFYLMNQDAWIFEDSFEKLLEVYENHPKKNEIGIISPMHLDGTERALDPHFERYLARGNEENKMISGFYFNDLNPAYEVPFVNAAHWLLPKKTIEVVGGFNPYFFHGAEDYDYVNRVKFHQKKIFVATQSRVVHDAKKQIPENNPEKAQKIRQVSARMQTETKYMDPAFPFNIKNEKRAFLTSIAKHTVLSNNKARKNASENFNFFKPKFNEIEEIRRQIFTEKNVFLKL